MIKTLDLAICSILKFQIRNPLLSPLIHSFDLTLIGTPQVDRSIGLPKIGRCVRKLARTPRLLKKRDKNLQLPYLSRDTTHQGNVIVRSRSNQTQNAQH